MGFEHKKLRTVFAQAALFGAASLFTQSLIHADSAPAPVESLLPLVPVTIVSSPVVSATDAAHDHLDRLLRIVRDNYVEKKTAEEWSAIFKSAHMRMITDQMSMTESLNTTLEELDPHASYIPPEFSASFFDDDTGKVAGIGAAIHVGKNYVTLDPVEDSPAYKAGIRNDDLLIAINDMRLSKNLLKRSRQIDSLPDIPHVSVTLTVVHKGEKKPTKIKVLTDEWISKPVSIAKIGKDIGYAKFMSFDYRLGDGNGNELKDANGDPVENGYILLAAALRQLRDEMGSNMKGLILDLRNNPGGDIVQAANVSALFLNKGQPIVTAQYRHPGEDTAFFASDSDIMQGLPIVVLVNSRSASGSEVVAGALQDHKRVTVMGSQTHGKGTITSVRVLDDKSVLQFTSGRYFTPNGRSLHLDGVTPDIEVIVPKLWKTSTASREQYKYKALPRPVNAVPDTTKTTAACSITSKFNPRNFEAPAIFARDTPDYHVLCAIQHLRGLSIPGVVIHQVKSPTTGAAPLNR